MACCLIGTKPLLEPMLTYCQVDPLKNIQYNFNQNYNIFIHENVVENVDYETPAIF